MHPERHQGRYGQHRNRGQVLVHLGERSDSLAAEPRHGFRRRQFGLRSGVVGVDPVSAAAREHDLAPPGGCLLAYDVERLLVEGSRRIVRLAQGSYVSGAEGWVLHGGDGRVPEVAVLRKGPASLALLPAGASSHQQAEAVHLGEAGGLHSQGDISGVRAAGQLDAHAPGCCRRLADHIGQQLVQSSEWINAGPQRTRLKDVFGRLRVLDAESRGGERGRCPFGEAVDAFEQRLGRVVVLPRQRSGDDA
ncbi:hypothetical protein ACIQXD_23595 [Streptomyces uncialis]|uniref:hypothetical protein n=1 Tax=Streptomyces uncialis TaxID=1048205 RepID=UPI0038030329